MNRRRAHFQRVRQAILNVKISVVFLKSSVVITMMTAVRNLKCLPS